MTNVGRRVLLCVRPSTGLAAQRGRVDVAARFKSLRQRIRTRERAFREAIWRERDVLPCVASRPSHSDPSSAIT